MAEYMEIKLSQVIWRWRDVQSACRVACVLFLRCSCASNTDTVTQIMQEVVRRGAPKSKQLKIYMKIQYL